MKLTTQKLFEQCYGKYAIAAVNVYHGADFGITSAAQRCKSPFIVQTTPVARNYAGQEMLLSMIDAASNIFPDVVLPYIWIMAMKTCHRCNCLKSIYLSND